MIDWSKVPEKDQEIHEKYRIWPFNRDQHVRFQRIYGDPILDQIHDIMGLEIRIVVWEHEKGLASVMYVEGEPFDDRGRLLTDDIEKEVQTMLDTFAVGSPFETATYEINGVEVQFARGGNGFDCWAMDRRHLFYERDGLYHVRPEYLKE